jgi:hypothetical protein
MSDLEFRELERRLQTEPTSENKLAMLRLKYRLGRLSVKNVLFRLAGYLGDPEVRTFAKEIGLKESWAVAAPDAKFNKLLAKQLISLSGEEKIPERLAKIAGIVALVWPYVKAWDSPELETELAAFLKIKFGM